MAELRRLNNLVSAAFAPQLRVQIEAIATTASQKKIWNLMDGSRTTRKLAADAGIGERSVQLLAAELLKAGLVDRSPAGAFRRIADIRLDELGPAKQE